MREYINEPLEAVADAMMYAQAVQMGDDPAKRPCWVEKFAWKRKDPTEKMELTLQDRTEGNCDVGSSLALYFLKLDYQHLFSNLVLLETYKDPDFRFNLDSYSYHVYFLAKDQEGTFYAGSPANHQPKLGKSPLTNIIRSTDLGKVMAEITAFEGGNWPDQKYIKDILYNGYLRWPVVSSRRGRTFLNAVTIGRDEGRDYFFIEKNELELPEEDKPARIAG